MSIRFSDREDAEWLAAQIDALAKNGTFPGCPGHTGQVVSTISWMGDLGDDCTAWVNDLHCHAEHLYGPFRGGAWYCSVIRARQFVFHTADHGIIPRSGNAARWLCELVVYREIAGITNTPDTDHAAIPDRSNAGGE